jgi:hypothetical protein
MLSNLILKGNYRIKLFELQDSNNKYQIKTLIGLARDLNGSKSIQYIIFRLNLSIISHNQINRMAMKIKNFNPEEIKIPGINESFRLPSTIKYI